MATFRVGQRVRIVRTAPKPAGQAQWGSGVPIGSEGTIVAVQFAPKGALTMAGNILTCDLHFRVRGDNGKFCGVADWMIEPLYDGHQTVEWSECLWQPTKETA